MSSRAKTEARAPERTGPQENFGYSGVHRTIEWCGLLCLAGMTPAVLWRMADILAPADQLWVWPTTAMAGYLLGDFLSGLVHWAGDRYGAEDTPWVGPNFVRPFREHHTDPEAITHHDFVELTGNSSLLALLFVAPSLLLVPVLLDPVPAALVMGILTFSAAACFGTNLFHKWAHMDDLPVGVHTLQRLGLLLSKEHHEVHHTPPHDSYYCITTGWCNWVLARLHFWAGMERLLAFLGLRTSV